MIADHTWVPVLQDWMVEIQPIIVAFGLVGVVLGVWQLVLSTFEPRKRWKQWRKKGDD